MSEWKCATCGSRIPLFSCRNGLCGSKPHPAPAEIVGVDDGRKYTIDAAGRMIPDDEHPFRGPAASEPRVWWIAFEGDPRNDKDSYKRYVGEWPFTGTRIPGEDIVKVIEHSAYQALRREADESVASLEVLRKECDGLERERDALNAGLESVQFHYRNLFEERDKLRAELAEAKRELAELRAPIDIDIRKTLDGLLERAERMGITRHTVSEFFDKWLDQHIAWHHANERALKRQAEELAGALEGLAEITCAETGLEKGVDFEPGDTSAIGDAYAVLARYRGDGRGTK